MGYETTNRYYNNYGIEPYDLEALNFFITSCKDYKGEIHPIMKKALKSIELENTHPIGRKWFHF
jgi:hypothetical protein